MIVTPAISVVNAYCFVVAGWWLSQKGHSSFNHNDLKSFVSNIYLLESLSDSANAARAGNLSDHIEMWNGYHYYMNELLKRSAGGMRQWPTTSFRGQPAESAFSLWCNARLTGYGHNN